MTKIGVDFSISPAARTGETCDQLTGQREAYQRMKWTVGVKPKPWLRRRPNFTRFRREWSKVLTGEPVKSSVDLRGREGAGDV